MSDIYKDFTSQGKTASILDTNRIVNLAYDDIAFNDNETAGRDVYNYNAHNNIPLTTGLGTPTQTLGFGGKSGVFKRSFINHTIGRISYNLNKAIQALRNLLSSFRSDYSENISEYSEFAGYSVGDVCYVLDGNDIVFYRCKAKIAEPAGAFNGVFWEEPEEELAHNRPAIGVPVLWFDKVPDDETLGVGKGWAIRFDDGASHTWEQCPALNFAGFKALVTLTADGFIVSDFRGKVPMFTGDANEVQTGYTGDAFDACVQSHSHSSPALTFTIPATSISHTHDSATSTGSGTHQHLITNRCDYDDKDNKTRTPIDDVDRYNPATLTDYAGSHSHTGTTSSAGVDAHTHTVTITGATGGVKEETGGNPDSFQSCWIVRYK